MAKRIESSTELLRKWLFSGAAAGWPRHQTGGTMPCRGACVLHMRAAACLPPRWAASALHVQTLMHCLRMLRRTIRGVAARLQWARRNGGHRRGGRRCGGTLAGGGPAGGGGGAGEERQGAVSMRTASSSQALVFVSDGIRRPPLMCAGTSNLRSLAGTPAYSCAGSCTLLPCRALPSSVTTRRGTCWIPRRCGAQLQHPAERMLCRRLATWLLRCSHPALSSCGTQVCACCPGPGGGGGWTRLFHGEEWSWASCCCQNVDHAHEFASALLITNPLPPTGFRVYVQPSFCWTGAQPPATRPACLC